MAAPCKMFTFTNVETDKGVLANIASSALGGGWTVDKDSVATDGELYLHSVGNGHQRLFFSLRLEPSVDPVPVCHLMAHGNTGFDASATWDAQPGRFTERIRPSYSLYQNKKDLFSFYDTEGKPETRFGAAAWWIVPPVAEQIVLVCPSFIMTVMRVVHPQATGTFSGWVPFFFGAADGFRAQENELNMVLSSLWGVRSYYGRMLSTLFPIKDSLSGTNYPGRDKPCGTIGFLYGGQNVEQLPPVDSGYGYSGIPQSVIRTSVFSSPSLFETYAAHGTDVTHYKEKYQRMYKGYIAPQVVVYDAALLQNPGTLRAVLIKPLVYVCRKEGPVEIAGELPYYAVNLTGLRVKDILRYGGRSFLILPNITDKDGIGLAVEVESA